MEFINRESELARINQALMRDESMLLILYGRRRIGKTRLIQAVNRTNDIYFTADQRERPLQIAAFSHAVAAYISDFSDVIYPDWETCLRVLASRISERTNGLSGTDDNGKRAIFIDEFPYLVKNSPDLPRVIQKLFDRREELAFHLVLCGSSQKMMHDLVIDSRAPLYGRANEIIRLSPMHIFWLKEILGCDTVQAVLEYSVWGGIPRYWELRIQEKGLKEAVISHIFSPQGALHEEALRLFLDDSRDTIQMASLIDLVASGAHRLSEIASRMNKPATHLNRPLQRLIDLGYLKREIPYGVSHRNAKRTLYKVADPFIAFYFKFVVPGKTLLELGHAERIFNELVRTGFPEHCSAIWEDLCRESVPELFSDKLFNKGCRWWGRTSSKTQAEIDIVAESHDGKEIVVGEVKWTGSVNVPSLCNELETKIKGIPVISGKKIRKALFLKYRPEYIPEGFLVFTPEEVVRGSKAG